MMQNRYAHKSTAIILGATLLTSLLAFAAPALSQINDLKALANQNASRIERQGLKHTLLESQLSSANAEAKKNNYEGGDRVSALRRKLLVELEPFKASEALRLETLQNAYDDKLLNNLVEDRISSIATTKEKIKLTHSALALAQLELDSAKTQHQLGLIKALDVNSKELALNDLKRQLLSEETTLKKHLVNLNALIGAPLEDERLIDYPIVIIEEAISFSDSTVDAALLNHLSVQRAASERSCAQLKYDLTAQFYKDFDKEYKEALYVLEIAKLDYTDAYSAVSIEAVEKLGSLHLLYESFLIEEEALNLAEQTSQATKNQFSLGARTELEVNKSAHLLKEAQYNYLHAIHLYNQAYRHYRLHVQTP